MKIIHIIGDLVQNKAKVLAKNSVGIYHIGEKMEKVDINIIGNVVPVNPGNRQLYRFRIVVFYSQLISFF